MRPFWEVSALFLKLGFTAFGGPAAHIALMRKECVERRRWLEEIRFLDLLGATNLIPGPNSTEMAIHLGYLRAGWPGLFAAGLCFILPATGIMLVLAWGYARTGSLPQTAGLLYGIKPVVLALVLQALWGLAGNGLKGRAGKGIFVAALAAYFYGLDEIAILAAAGFACWAAGNRETDAGAKRGAAAPLLALGLPAAAAASACMPLGVLFLKFLKIGSVLFGSGYVLLPFVRAAFAGPGGPLTETQVLDAIAMGQVTPGPFFTTATFIGYLLGGVPGGLMATAGIFLPAFFFVAVSGPFLPRLRASAALGRVLDGVIAASLALMAGAAWHMAKTSITDWTAGALLAGALLLSWRKVSPTLLIAVGGGMGVAARMWGG